MSIIGFDTVTQLTHFNAPPCLASIMSQEEEGQDGFVDFSSLDKDSQKKLKRTTLNHFNAFLNRLKPNDANNVVITAYRHSPEMRAEN